MGVSLAQIGQLNEATVAFQKALSIRPDYGEGYNNLGNVLKILASWIEQLRLTKKHFH